MALEETVVLDIADGLHQIDALEEALTASAQAFKVALADALDVLTAVQVQDVDASQITTSIDSAVAAADLALEPEIDASGVTTAIDDSVGAADTNVEIEALTAQVTDDINSAIADADTTITVEADTSAAEADISGLADQVQGLGDNGGDASGGIGGLAGNIGLLGVGARAAAGDTAAAGGAIAGMGASAARGVGVVVALGFAVKTFTDEALAADAATRRFNATFGPLADDINQIDIGGLNESLSDLALRLGADDDQLRQAASSIGQVGLSSGKTQEEVAKTAEQLLVLAANVSAVNPQLGTADQIIGGLSNGLARGGKFLGQFGIALTSAEINARALADTGKKAASDLTIYEKAAAGAALASEKLGTSIKDNIDKGAETPTIKLRALKQQLLETFEGAGKQLIDPLVNSFEALTPVLVISAELLGPILKLALTGLAGSLQLVARLLGGTAIGIQQIFEAASHLPFVGDKFDGFADNAGDAAKSLLDAADASKKSEAGSDKAGAAAADAAPSFEDLATAAADAEKSLSDLLDAQIAYLDADVAAVAASDRFLQSLQDQTEKQKAATDAIRDYGHGSQEAIDAVADLSDSNRNVRETALASAEAQLRLAQDLATASGTALTAKQSQDIFRQSLENLARGLKGDQLAAVQGLIDKLDEAAKTRTATLEANVSPALGKLSFLEANLEALRAKAKHVADIVSTLPGFAPGTGPQLPGAMAGGSFSGGDTGMAFDVGERGREVVFIGPNQQATVIPAERANNLFSTPAGESALVAALTRLASQPQQRSAPVVEQLVVNEVSADPRATAFHVAARLGEEARR